MNASLISIRPKYAERIFLGTKTVELRRRAPRVGPGHIFFVYESAPVMAIRGCATVTKIEARRVGALWRAIRPLADVTREEFDTYFHSCEMGVAIHLTRVTEFDAGIPLSELREMAPFFHPPQSWVALGAMPLPLQKKLRDELKKALLQTPSLPATR